MEKYDNMEEISEEEDSNVLLVQCEYKITQQDQSVNRNLFNSLKSLQGN